MKWILGCAAMGFLILPSVGSAQDRFDLAQFRSARLTRMDWSGETFGQLLRRTAAKRPARVRPEQTSVAAAEARRLGLGKTQRNGAASE